VSSIGVREGSEIERAVTALAGSSNRCLIMTPTSYTAPVRNLIIALAARHKLPTVYYQRHLVAAGGLASYGPDFLDEYRRAAGYVNRVLRDLSRSYDKVGDVLKTENKLAEALQSYRQAFAIREHLT
jgi:putative ABC transport system substrate-binding protein